MLRFEEIQVADVMTTPPLCFRPGTPARVAAQTLLEEGLHGAPVVARGGPPREVSVEGLLRWLLDSPGGEEALAGRSLGDLGLEPMLCRPAELPFPEACQQMVRAGVRRLLVADEAHPEPLGIFSAVDALRAVACLADLHRRSERARPAARRVRDAMQRDVPSLQPGDPARAALRLMAGRPSSHLPVVDGGEVVGIVSRRDLLDRCARELEEDGRASLDQPTWGVMTPGPLETATPGEPLVAAIRRLERVGALPVLEEGRLVGLLTRSDALRDYAGALGGGGLLPAGLRAEISALVALT
ncbi:MAG: CBS domain-containing protein [Planctomycetota bacterium]